MSKKPSIDVHINESNERRRHPDFVPVVHSTGTELRGRIHSKKRYPIRPEVNYDRPLTKLVKPKIEARSSPKTVMGLRFQRMYGKPKPKGVKK